MSEPAVEAFESISKIAHSASEAFKPEAVLVAAAKQVHDLPLDVRDKVKEAVNAMLGSLPSSFQSFMAERATRISNALPEQMREKLKKEPGTLFTQSPMTLLASMNQNQQSEAASALQELLMGALQFVSSQP